MDNEIFFRRHLIVHGFMKGILNLKPELPRQLALWGPDAVLGFLSSLKCKSSLNGLSEKLVTLLCLLSGLRNETININANNQYFELKKDLQSTDHFSLPTKNRGSQHKQKVSTHGSQHKHDW